MYWSRRVSVIWILRYYVAIWMNQNYFSRMIKDNNVMYTKRYKQQVNIWTPCRHYDSRLKIVLKVWHYLMLWKDIKDCKSFKLLTNETNCMQISFIISVKIEIKSWDWHINTWNLIHLLCIDRFIYWKLSYCYLYLIDIKGSKH